MNFYTQLIQNRPYHTLIGSIILVLLLSRLVLNPDIWIDMLIFGLISLAVTMLLVAIIKPIVGKKRRTTGDLVDDYSMPSFHVAVCASSCIIGICYLPIATHGVFWLLLIFTMYGRIDNGEHSKSEVIAGCILGSLIAFICYLTSLVVM